MLTKKQLENALTCQDRDCNMCSLFVAGGYCATPAAQTALAYREMLERLEYVCAGHCPVCGWYMTHRDNCKLAALLREGGDNERKGGWDK